MKISSKQAKQLAKYLGIDLRKISLKQWMYALQVELEHGTEFSITNVTNDDLLMTAKIALAHVMEYPDYYVRLKAMEKEAEFYWKNKRKPKIFIKAKSKMLSVGGKPTSHIKDKIIIFFKENPVPSDKQIHNLAENMNINKHEIEECIYEMFGKCINTT